jgi:hypothetical protein
MFVKCALICLPVFKFSILAETSSFSNETIVYGPSNFSFMDMFGPVASCSWQCATIWPSSKVLDTRA